MDLSAIVDSLRTDTVAAVRDSAATLRLQFAEAFKAAIVVDDSPERCEEREGGWAALGDRIETLTAQATAVRQAAFQSLAHDDAGDSMRESAQAMTERLQALLGGPVEDRKSSDPESLDETLSRLFGTLRGGDPSERDRLDTAEPDRDDRDESAHVETERRALWRFLPQARPYSRRELWEAPDERHTR